MRRRNPFVIPILFLVSLTALTLITTHASTLLNTSDINQVTLIMIYAIITCLTCYYIMTFIHEIAHAIRIKHFQKILHLPKRKIYIHLYPKVKPSGFTYSDTLLDLVKLKDTDNYAALDASKQIVYAPYSPIVKLTVSIFILSLITCSIYICKTNNGTELLFLLAWNISLLLNAALQLFFIHETDTTYFNNPDKYEITYRITGWFKRPEVVQH